MRRIRFLVSYDCEADYEVDGLIYRVRYGMHYSLTREDLREEIRSRIGTVMHADCDRWDRFPSPEVMALFPGFVGARYNAATLAREFGDGLGPWIPEYDGSAPEWVEKWSGAMLAAYARDPDEFLRRGEAARAGMEVR